MDREAQIPAQKSRRGPQEAEGRRDWRDRCGDIDDHDYDVKSSDARPSRKRKVKITCVTVAQMAPGDRHRS
jgi:hypothetical protein